MKKKNSEKNTLHQILCLEQNYLEKMSKLNHFKEFLKIKLKRCKMHSKWKNRLDQVKNLF